MGCELAVVVGLRGVGLLFYAHGKLALTLALKSALKMALKSALKMAPKSVLKLTEKLAWWIARRAIGC